MTERNIKISKKLTDRIDTIFKKKGFRNRTEFVIYLIRKELDEIESKEKIQLINQTN